MICRKCANMFDDSLTNCPECGTNIFSSDSPEKKENKAAAFVLNIPDEEIEKPIIIKAGEHKDRKEEEKLPETSEAEAYIEEDEPSQEEADLNEDEPSQRKEIKEKKEEKPQVVRRTANPSPARRTVQKKAVTQEKKPDTVGDKAAATLIISIVCILSCVMMVLTVVGIKSDVFKADADVVKTVAMSGLSGEQKGELEQWLSNVGVICEDGIDTSQKGISAVLSLIRPYDTDGIYCSVYEKTDIIAGSSDPAQRFANENGDYSYYRLDGDKVDSLVNALGYTPNHTINTPDFYYYGGSYYFRDKGEKKTNLYIADVGNSKRIMDGSYYVECSFLDKNNLSGDEKKRYAIVEELDDGEGIPYRVRMLSEAPIFDEGGIMIHSSATYEMKTFTVEKKAKDGTVYHRYVIEYPEFSGNTQGEKIANQLFSDMINVYKAEDETVDTSYESFLEKGGDKNELPFITHIVSRVTYNKGGYLSFVEETAEYTPSSVAEKKTEEENLPVTMPKRTVEGYNLDSETGDFITKDAIIGKDYQNIAELLYRIYKGYSYDDLKLKFKENLDEGLKSEENAEESVDASVEEIPEDSEDIGLKIYESASVITESGYMFCFVTEEGYAVDVVIPFDIQGLYVVDINK